MKGDHQYHCIALRRAVRRLVYVSIIDVIALLPLLRVQFNIAARARVLDCAFTSLPLTTPAVSL